MLLESLPSLTTRPGPIKACLTAAQASLISGERLGVKRGRQNNHGSSIAGKFTSKTCIQSV